MAGSLIPAWRIAGREAFVQIFVCFRPLALQFVSHCGRTGISNIHMAVVGLVRRKSRVTLLRFPEVRSSSEQGSGYSCNEGNQLEHSRSTFLPTHVRHRECAFLR